MYTSGLSQFHLKCNIYSITSKLTIDLTLNYVKMFEFQNGSTKKLTNKVIVKCLASGPKVTTTSIFVIKLNLCTFLRNIRFNALHNLVVV